jgi:hypothetical protein
LLVWDGDVLYVDRSGDGDLTAPRNRIQLKEKRLTESVPISANGNQVKIVSLRPIGDHYVRITVEGKFLQYGDIKPAVRREHATTLHFDGPLVMGLVYSDLSKQSLRRSSKPHQFAVVVTTTGSRTKEVLGPVIDHNKYVPAHAHPIAEFEFAPRNVGSPPIKLKATLDRHC